MKTGIFLSITKVDKSDITKLEARYRIQSGRIGFYIDEKSEEFSLTFLNNSYVWDFPNNKFIHLTDLANKDDFFVFLRRFTSSIIGQPSSKIYYHEPKNDVDLKSYTYNVLPFLGIYKQTPEIIDILNNDLGCYSFVSHWDTELNMIIYTKEPDFIIDKINKEAERLSIPIHKVNPAELPVW